MGIVLSYLREGWRKNIDIYNDPMCVYILNSSSE